MIKYSTRGSQAVLFIFRWKGSTFPHALLAAFPCAVLTAVLAMLHVVDEEDVFLTNSAVWSGFSFLVGFLMVFRTSQAYQRFWDGATAIHKMRAEWFDAASAMVAFTRMSKGTEDEVWRFKDRMVRLFSLLHACAILEIEDDCLHGECQDTGDLQLIDPEGLSKSGLQTWKATDRDMKANLVFYWIQALIVDGIRSGLLEIPPPILSRVFQEIANGMVALHDAAKIAEIPFPFPYAQICTFLLLTHWALTPLVTLQWTTSVVWAFVFSFVQVFIFWCLNLTAIELEQPFGRDANDLQTVDMQKILNQQLLLLLDTRNGDPPDLEKGFKDEIVGEARRCSMISSISSTCEAGNLEPSSLRRPSLRRDTTVSYNSLSRSLSAANLEGLLTHSCEDDAESPGRTSPRRCAEALAAEAGRASEGGARGSQAERQRHPVDVTCRTGSPRGRAPERVGGPAGTVEELRPEEPGSLGRCEPGEHRCRSRGGGLAADAVEANAALEAGPPQRAPGGSGEALSCDAPSSGSSCGTGRARAAAARHGAARARAATGAPWLARSGPPPLCNASSCGLLDVACGAARPPGAHGGGRGHCRQPACASPPRGGERRAEAARCSAGAGGAPASGSEDAGGAGDRRHPPGGGGGAGGRGHPGPPGCPAVEPGAGAAAGHRRGAAAPPGCREPPCGGPRGVPLTPALAPQRPEAPLAPARDEARPAPPPPPCALQ